jgi:hypothetical protein
VSSLKEEDIGFCKVFMDDCNRGQLRNVAGESTTRDNWKEQMTRLFTDKDDNFNRELCLAASRIMQQGTFALFFEKFFTAALAAECDNLTGMSHYFEIAKNLDGNYTIKVSYKCIMSPTDMHETGKNKIVEEMKKDGMPIYSVNAEIILPANGDLNEVTVQSFSHSLLVKESASARAEGYAEKLTKEFPVPINNDYPKSVKVR